MLFSNKDLKRLIIPLVIKRLLVIMVGFFDPVKVSRVGEIVVSAVFLVDGNNIFAALGTGGAVVAAQFIGQVIKKKVRYSAKQ